MFSRKSLLSLVTVTKLGRCQITSLDGTLYPSGGSPGRSRVSQLKKHGQIFDHFWDEPTLLPTKVLQKKKGIRVPETLNRLCYTLLSLFQHVTCDFCCFLPKVPHVACRCFGPFVGSIDPDAGTVWRLLADGKAFEASKKNLFIEALKPVPAIQGFMFLVPLSLEAYFFNPFSRDSTI